MLSFQQISYNLARWAILIIRSFIFVKMNPQKKLKLILASLKDRQIIKFFQAFSLNFPDQIKKSVRQISFNCFQSVCEFKNKIVSGYGKNSQQSFVNSIRTLVQLLADDSKLHSIMRQSLRQAQQSASNNCESQKKLSYIQRQSTSNLKNVTVHCTTKPAEKKTTLKQQIFQYLNLDNLKISNPNTTHKAKTHDKYMKQSSQQQDRPSLEQILKKNADLQQKIMQAKEQNSRLKLQLKQNQAKNNKQKEIQIEDIEDSQNAKKEKQKISYSNLRPRQSYEPLKPRTNEYLNLSQDTKILQKSKMRSVSVEASQTQKYIMPKTNQKKITVPKLNLQVLPNYHGKSNKSLNQSLMQVYQKTHAK